MNLGCPRAPQPLVRISPELRRSTVHSRQEKAPRERHDPRTTADCGEDQRQTQATKAGFLPEARVVASLVAPSNTAWDLAEPRPPSPFWFQSKLPPHMLPRPCPRRSVSGGGTAPSRLRPRRTPGPQAASAQACGGHAAEESRRPAVTVLSDGRAEHGDTQVT